MKKKIPFLLLLLTFTAFALPVSVFTDKQGYAKGETVKITGNATPGSLVSVSLTSWEITLYSDKFIASNGTFSAVYPISNSDPKGNWTVTASLSKGPSASTSFQVNPTREGAYYVVTFTSPTFQDFEYPKTDTVPVSVSLFDAGKPVSGASLRAWAGGKPFVLLESSPGVYSGDYWIPPETRTGQLEIYVVAEKKSGTTSFGGEKSIPIKTKPVPIQIDFQSPASDVYKTGDTIQVKVKLTYATGRPVTDAVVLVNANGIPITLTKNIDTYSGEFKTGESDAGVLKLTADAEDVGKNIGSAYRNVNVRSPSISDYYWQIILGFIVVISVAVFIVKTYLDRSALRDMVRKRDELITLEKGLQEEYLKKKSIDRETFERRMSNYESKLSELNESIKKRNKGKQAQASKTRSEKGRNTDE